MKTLRDLKPGQIFKLKGKEEAFTLKQHRPKSHTIDGAIVKCMSHPFNNFEMVMLYEAMRNGKLGATQVEVIL